MRNHVSAAFLIVLLGLGTAPLQAEDLCVPNIGPQGLDRTLPCKEWEVPPPELRDGIFFAPGASTLTDEARSTLDRQSAFLRVRPDLVINLLGFADDREAPSGLEKAALGLERARAVEGYLIEKGIAPSRLAASGAEHAPFIPVRADERTLARMRKVIVVPALP